MVKCSITECDRKQIAKSFCTKHYRRFKLYGDPHKVNPRSKPPIKKKKYFSCNFQDCLNPYYGKGYCQKHYQRLIKHGDSNIVLPPSYKLKYPDLKTRFETFVNKQNSVTDCWLWMGRITNGGYGQIRKNGKSMQAHRVSYELYVDLIPSGLFICHSCDQRNCVNFRHLFVGTAKDNMQDMIKKNRNADVKGSKNGAAKLNEIQVQEIKYKLKTGMLHKEIAKLYNVGRSTIGLIKNNIIWKHIT